MTAPFPRRMVAAAFLLCGPVVAAGCAAARPAPNPARAAAALCEGQVPASVKTIQRGRVVPGQAVQGDLLRADSAGGLLGPGEDVWVYAAAHDGPATVRIHLPRRDVWLTTRILYGTRGFDQLGVGSAYAEGDATHRMIFRAQPGRCYAFHVTAFGSDTTARTTEYTLRVEAGAPVQHIRVGQTVNASLGSEDQSRVQAALSRIYYFEDWAIVDTGSGSLRARMEADSADGEGTLALGTVHPQRGTFDELRRVGGATPEIVFVPEPGRRYLLRAEMPHVVMDRRYRLIVERVAPSAP